jgi:hypothetical protein
VCKDEEKKNREPQKNLRGHETKKNKNKKKIEAHQHERERERKEKRRETYIGGFLSLVPTLREALFFCNDGKLMEGKHGKVRECGKKEEKKNACAREQRGTRMMIGERTAAVSDKFQAR